MEVYFSLSFLSEYSELSYTVDHFHNVSDATLRTHIWPNVVGETKLFREMKEVLVIFVFASNMYFLWVHSHVFHLNFWFIMWLKFTSVTDVTESDMPQGNLPLIRPRLRRVDNAKENLGEMWRCRLIKLAEDIFQFVSTVMNFRSFVKVGDLLTSLETLTLYRGIGYCDYYFLKFPYFLSYTELNKVWSGIAGPAFLIIPILSPCLAHRRLLDFTYY
jgi:hypothetical protein